MIRHGLHSGTEPVSTIHQPVGDITIFLKPCIILIRSRGQLQDLQDLMRFFNVIQLPSVQYFTVQYRILALELFDQ